MITMEAQVSGHSSNCVCETEEKESDYNKNDEQIYQMFFHSFACYIFFLFEIVYFVFLFVFLFDFFLFGEDRIEFNANLIWSKEKQQHLLNGTKIFF